MLELDGLIIVLDQFVVVIVALDDEIVVLLVLFLVLFLVRPAFDHEVVVPIAVDAFLRIVNQTADINDVLQFIFVVYVDHKFIL